MWVPEVPATDPFVNEVSITAIHVTEPFPVPMANVIGHVPVCDTKRMFVHCTRLFSVQVCPEAHVSDIFSELHAYMLP